MKKEWKGFLAVLSIALLLAAVALMPACDTGGESCDLDLESLNGSWQVIVTPEGEAPELPNTVIFTVSGDTLTVDDGGDIQEFNLDCGGDRVTLSMSETIPPEDIKFMFPDSDCTVTMTRTIRVTVSSPDAFAGTQSQAFTLSGPNCTDIEAFLTLLLGEDMAEAAEITATRTEI